MSDTDVPVVGPGKCAASTAWSEGVVGGGGYKKDSDGDGDGWGGGKVNCSANLVGASVVGSSGDGDESIVDIILANS